MIKSEFHESVMVHEVIEFLHIKKDSEYIDATVGTGGHSSEIIGKGGKLLGIEADRQMLEIADKRLGILGGSYQLALGNFVKIDEIAKKNNFNNVSGVLFDLGVSNIHLTSKTRGFSFANPKAPLDMRLNPTFLGVKGSDLLNALREDQLIDLFEKTLEAGSARWLTKRVTGRRSMGPIETVGDFIEICQDLSGKPGLNPATLPFLALRIAVNSELENLEEALPKAFRLLQKGGRLLVISFHSGEDAIVKHFFQGIKGEILTDKPVIADTQEIEANPRARSAKLRVIEKI